MGRDFANDGDVTYAQPIVDVEGFDNNLKELRQIIAREPEITLGEIDPAMLLQLVRKENLVILDIGCNKSGDTLLFLSLSKQCESCFEEWRINDTVCCNPSFSGRIQS